MAIVRINQASIAYSEHGSGPPLVLVHGSASDLRTWRAQQPLFARQYRVIAYSRRYHWPNKPIVAGADYSMEEHLQDLAALLDTLEIAPAHLVGHSYGAFLALLLAVRQPHLVRTLVLAEAPVLPLFVSNVPKPLEIVKLVATRPRTAAAIGKFLATGMAPAVAAAKRGDMEAAMRMFGTAILGRDSYRRLSESRRKQVQANCFRSEFLGSGFVPLAADQLRSMQATTLLLTARHSPRLFHCIVDRLAELLPHAERAEVADASHIMHEDNPSAFNDAVLTFLARNHSAA